MKAERKKHLILDVDETIYHSILPGDGVDMDNLTEPYKSLVSTIRLPGNVEITGVFRPYLLDFLQVAFEEFASVSVWSAGTYEYVHGVLAEIMGEEMKSKLRFVMTRNDCNNIQDVDVSGRFKPLSIVFQRYSDMNETNTLLVDDRDDVCFYSMMNHVLIPAFFPTNEALSGAEKIDDALQVLSKWFQSPTFRKKANVQELKRYSPFPF